MTEADMHDLIPDVTLLFDGSGSKEEFIDLGNGFMWNLLVARARLLPQHSVLDIGSGNGQKARALTKYLDSNGKYFGFDVVENGINWCKEQYLRFPNFQFDFADLQSDWYNQKSLKKDYEYVFPYKNDFFDVAFMASVATHLLPKGLENYLKQSFRVLKRQGCLLFTCYLINQINEGRHAVRIQSGKFSRFSKECWVLDKEHPRKGVAYDERFLRQLCKETGFVLSELTFGTWSNATDRLASLQDTVLLVKP